VHAYTVVNAGAALIAGVAIAGCGGSSSIDTVQQPRIGKQTIRLQSPAFADGSDLPREFTCDGAGTSPPLRWSGVPPRTREFGLVVTDPYPRAGPFRHWTVWGIPAATRSLAAGHVPRGAHQGQNSAGKVGWTPACPPHGGSPHRYFFTIVALSKHPTIPDGATVDVAVQALRDAALGTGQIAARYGR
jgi:Raf kinase inhibitor-like YbhB/YbcL family protein